MGKIKLLMLSTFLFGQLAFACGTKITGGPGHNWQGNASSPCPSDTNSSSTSVKADIGGMNFGPGYFEAMAAKAAAESSAAKKRHCMDQAKQMNNDAFDDISQRWSDETADCHLLFANEPSALAVCTEDAGNRYDSSIESQDELLEIRKATCNAL